MGQSPSAALDRDNSFSDRFGFFSSSFVSSDGFSDEFVGNRDYTAEIPDDCLAYVFQFLGPGDRKRCSLVCKRWLCVDGWSRRRLSLNAQSEIVASLPSLFTRFHSVTKLTLRCSRKSISINDDALVMISTRCRNLERLKLRGCREISDEGMLAFAQNSKHLRKFSCGSCMFGARALNAVLDYCTNLEELSVKRLRGIRDGAEAIGPGAAASSLKSICLKELVNGQSFEPLVVGAKNLKSLKIIHCLGDWDRVLQLIGNRNRYRKENFHLNNYDSNGNNDHLLEIHLERLQVSDIGLSAISKCTKIESLHIVKSPECSNYGLVCVAEHCKLLKKLHVDGWRTNRIGDEGLAAVAKHCPNLEELVLVGVNATYLSLEAIASNCSKLERLALCGSGTIGNTEIACIAAKCMALKKLCIKGCPISDISIEALGSGCPSLMKIKLRKCRGVSCEAGEWLREQRGSLVINMDACEIDGGFEASVSNGGIHEVGLDYPQVIGQVTTGDASTSSNGRLALLRSKFGVFASRNLVACTFRRWSNGDDTSNSNL
ncbi:VIER F-BOX PROTEINE 4, SKP1/ASK1-interacting protein 2 [Hibiscus trionum]|uniref:VIER F-BOX PROTEINE 4, SKP1/ASK1-interacting protein 2 n=1 Tax=Hibiscus trionum TaxID=183268 RepID=A0A9W7MBA8_HIBTR|nr:VIER F-BOX PROTEINE 4, SKP1/ASK1-interacting protein 2 [Hibiscus trionum]